MTSPSGRIVYVNGEFLPEADARLSIFDRGFLFGDGIYEVTSVLEGKLIDSDLHMARLERSAREIDVALPVTTGEIVEAERRLIADNNLVEGMIYLQLTENTPLTASGIAPAVIALAGYFLLSTMLSVQTLRGLGNLRFAVAVGLVLIGPMLLVWL